jgi:hypothetical protein
MYEPDQRSVQRIFWFSRHVPRCYWANPARTQPPASRRITTAVILTLALAACTNDKEITSPETRVSRSALLEALTPTLAQSVGADGRFQVAAPLVTGRRQITGRQAGLLAIAVAKYNMPYLDTYWTAQRGGPIDYQKLTLCEDPLYAVSPFERLANDVTTEQAHPIQKAIGPFFLVRLCGTAGDPQVKVAVSAYSTDPGINRRGEVIFPAIGGGDFLTAAIPIGQPANEMPSAEEATVLAANFTGRKVAAVPELVVPFFKDDNPLGARWRLRLETPALMRTRTGQEVEASEVYVSGLRRDDKQGSQTWTADADQPSEVSVRYMPLTFVGENINAYTKRQQAETRMVPVLRRQDVPVQFSAITAR